MCLVGVTVAAPGYAPVAHAPVAVAHAAPVAVAHAAPAVDYFVSRLCSVDFSQYILFINKASSKKLYISQRVR